MTEAVVTPGKHGGARPGAGRKPKPKTGAEAAGDPYVVLAKAKAKHEAYKANLAELEFRRRAGELLERAHVEAAASRLHAMLAQSLRSLPDHLERRLGLSAEQAASVQDFIDGLTVEIRERLRNEL